MLSALNLFGVLLSSESFSFLAGNFPGRGITKLNATSTKPSTKVPMKNLEALCT
jgi:hypothetical protein